MTPLGVTRGMRPDAYPAVVSRRTGFSRGRRPTPRESVQRCLGPRPPPPGRLPRDDSGTGHYRRCMEPSRSGHLPINGLQIYFEAHGELGASETVPLLLIPGAFLSTESMAQWAAAFVAKRPVIVFDQQGHGRTADTARTMSYEQFGDDAAALL